jgi:hypothetical protein
VDDLAAAIVAIIRREIHGVRIAIVGNDPLALRDYIGMLRAQMGLGGATFVFIPMPVMRLLARIGKLLPGAILRPETLVMLNHESIADAGDTTRLLGHSPRGAAHFIPPDRALELRRQARLQWLMPLLSASMATLWIASGVVSLWFYPRADALGLLEAVGMPAALRPALLYLAAGADMLLGIGCLFLARKPWVWMLQIALVLAYTAILTLRLPQFWAHPFGPLTKNVPILALLVLSYIRARDRWNT